MRIFIGISLDDSVKNYLRYVSNTILSKAIQSNPTRFDNFHVTLLFLGDVYYSDLEEIELKILNQLKHIKPFYMTLGQIGSFIKGDQHLIFMGIDQGSNQFIHLNNVIKNAVSTTNFSIKVDTKKYHPHITLARQVIFQSNHTHDIPRFETKILIDHITIFKSEHIRNQLIYTPLSTLSFID